MKQALPQSVDETQKLLSKNMYIADRSIATSLLISFQLGRPIFLEGEAGVGKTEIANVLAQVLDRSRVRARLAAQGRDRRSSPLSAGRPPSPGRATAGRSARQARRPPQAASTRTGCPGTGPEGMSLISRSASRRRLADHATAEASATSKSTC